MDTAAENRQIARLNSIKKERDNTAVTAALKELQKVAQSRENTMPAFINCVEALATVGEICDALRVVFGVQREFLII